jgi:hypothetical protein
MRSKAETSVKKIQKLIPKYATANSDLIEIALSPHEKQNDALVIRSDRPAPHRVATAAQREILHIHEGTDWSIHCLLSPLDCKLGECGTVPWVLRG